MMFISTSVLYSCFQQNNLLLVTVPFYNITAILVFNLKIFRLILFNALPQVKNENNWWTYSE